MDEWASASKLELNLRLWDIGDSYWTAVLMKRQAATTVVLQSQTKCIRAGMRPRQGHRTQVKETDNIEEEQVLLVGLACFSSDAIPSHMSLLIVFELAMPL